MSFILSANILTPEVKRIDGMLAITSPLEEAIPFLADCGYKGLEFITVDPLKIDRNRLEDLMSRWGMVPVGVNTGRVCGELGLTLSSPDPSVRQRCIDKLKVIIDFASLWRIPVNVGIVRGTIKAGGDKDAVEAHVVRSLTELCDYAAGKGVDLMIETVAPPLMDYINTLDEAADLIAKVGRPNLCVMYDVLQMHLMESNLFESVPKHIGRCRHVHFADTSRLVPGDGDIDFERFIKALAESGYKGPGSIEIAPNPNEREVTRRAAEYLLPILGKYYK